MSNLNNVILSVVESFMKDEVLFTALDVSNKVKETMSNARHREVRDEVRALFLPVIEPAGWAKTAISVKLPDGTATEAILYHPLSDSWDLDTKYNDQKRTQTSLKSNTQAASTLVAQQQMMNGLPPYTSVSAGTLPVVSTTGYKYPVAPATPAAPTPAPVVSAPQPTQAQSSARDLWSKLFQSQPSLFPRK